jgi:hypothetical protein
LEREVTMRGNAANGTGAMLLALAAVLACCGLPFLFVTAGGAIAAVGGLAARYWPLTIVGLGAAVWGGVGVGRLIRARSRALRRSQGQDR